MTDDEKRLRRLEALVSGLLTKLDTTLAITCHEDPCGRCDGKGVWQDGGDCAYCSGASVIFTFKGAPP